MNEEHCKDPNPLSKEAPKRRRTPSQYASHIADFKNVPLSLSRTLLRPSKDQEVSNSYSQMQEARTIRVQAMPSL